MKRNPQTAIRQYCLSCCLENKNEVRLCPAVECPLHPYRFGKNPFYGKSNNESEESSDSAPENAQSD